MCVLDVMTHLYLIVNAGDKAGGVSRRERGTIVSSFSFSSFSVVLLDCIMIIWSL